MRGGAVRRAVRLALALGLASPGAVADYQHRVVLLEEPNSDEAATEVLSRVRGELTAAGFEVVLLPVAVEGDPATISETSARELLPAAVIFVIERPAEGTDPRRIELWLSDRLSRRTFVQSLPIEADDAGRGYKRLAVQAVELLKARLAELAVTKAPPKEPPPKHDEPKRPPPKPPAPKEPRVEGTVAGGVTLFQGFGGVDASLAPRLTAAASIPVGAINHAPFAVDLGGTLTAFGTRPTLRSEAGEAKVGQGLGTVDVALRFDRGATLQPVLTASAGLYAVAIEGTASGSQPAHDEQTWSMFTAFGAGILLQPSGSFGVGLGGQVGRAWAKTVVRIGGEEVAEAGSPLVLLSLAAVGIF